MSYSDEEEHDAASREHDLVVTVLPIKECLALLAEKRINEPIILLSSYPEPVMPPGSDYLFIAADDVTNPLRRGSFKLQQAQAIARFVESHNAASRLFVCCDGGVSRSAAVAAAIMYASTGNDEAFWLNSSFRPNPLVYSLTREALGFPCEENSLQVKIARNEDALKRKIESRRQRSSNTDNTNI